MNEPQTIALTEVLKSTCWDGITAGMVSAAIARPDAFVQGMAAASVNTNDVNLHSGFERDRAFALGVLVRTFMEAK